MTKYFWMQTKSMLKNPYLIFFSILFVEFWVFMWAFVFGTNIPPFEPAIREYLGTAFGALLVLSLSSAASGITMSLLYSSKSIRYVTKYTKLSPSRFFLENLLSSLAVLGVISLIMFLSVVLVFLGKFGMLVLPANGPGLFLSIILGTLFMYTLSLFLNLLIVVLKAPKSATFISFLPMMLGFLPYMSLWIDFGVVAYISPFNSLTSVCYHFFSGNLPPTGNYLMDPRGALMNMPLVVLSLLLWVILFVIADIVLLKKMRGVGVDEIRVV